MEPGHVSDGIARDCPQAELGPHPFSTPPWHLAFYTLSKAVDDASDPGATAFEANVPQDVRNMAAERGNASFDHRHRFVSNFTYELPNFGGTRGGWAAALASDWQVNGIVLLEAGAPFTVNIGTDRANIGAGPAQRPNQTCDPNEGGARTAQQWFNTSCFELQPQFTFGNAPRNSVLSPGYASVDLGMQKDVEIGGDKRLQFRWEIFNLLNRTNFDVPSRIAFHPTSAGSSARSLPARCSLASSCRSE